MLGVAVEDNTTTTSSTIAKWRRRARVSGSEAEQWVLWWIHPISGSVFSEASRSSTCQPIIDAAALRFSVFASASGSEDEHRLLFLTEMLIMMDLTVMVIHFVEKLKILKRLWQRLSFSRPLSS